MIQNAQIFRITGILVHAERSCMYRNAFFKPVCNLWKVYPESEQRVMSAQTEIWSILYTEVKHPQDTG